jgi:hypothetical protein
MRWVGHVARMREMRNKRFWSENNTNERDHLEEPNVDGVILLKEIFRK